MKTTQFTPVCTCQAVREYYDTGIGGMFEDKVRLCPFHIAAPAMYEALKRIKVLMESGDIEGRDWVEYGHIINALAQAEGRHPRKKETCK